MRKIVFRGKAKMTPYELKYMRIPHANGWVYGNLLQNEGVHFIVGNIVESTDEYICHEWWAEVCSESVGQLTSHKDSDGIEIYENDVIQYIEQNQYIPNYQEGKYGVELVDYDFKIGMSQLGVVKYNAPSFVFDGIKNTGNFENDLIKDISLEWLDGEINVVGNTYDNERLLEK